MNTNTSKHRPSNDYLLESKLIYFSSLNQKYQRKAYFYLTVNQNYVGFRIFIFLCKY